MANTVNTNAPPLQGTKRKHDKFLDTRKEEHNSAVYHHFKTKTKLPTGALVRRS
jgi:hypothetical protein